MTKSSRLKQVSIAGLKKHDTFSMEYIGLLCSKTKITNKNFMRKSLKIFIPVRVVGSSLVPLSLTDSSRLKLWCSAPGGQYRSYHSSSIKPAVGHGLASVSSELQQWPVPSKPQESPPEARPPGSSLPPRLLASPPPPPGV